MDPRSQRNRQEFVAEHIRPFTGCRVLDIGCGTGRILDFLPEVEYYGFDLSQRYIDYAVSRYGSRGHFRCAAAEQVSINQMEPFDIVLAIGVLHHLDDAQAVGLMRLVYSALRQGGQVVTLDGCYADDQNAISRFLVGRDRGQYVRSAEQYCDLARGIFTRVKGTLKHRRWIPYTHWIMECQR
jgi:SAM-dependent methyltransferase